MAGISSSTGLISGLNYQSLIQALVLSQTNAITAMQNRQKGIQAVRDGVNTLSAGLLSLSVSTTQLGLPATFQSFKADSSDSAQLTAIAQTSAAAGSRSFQVLRLASAQQVLSRGFVNSNQQTVGAGTIAISSGGKLQTETSLSSLNGGTGVRRGVIRITDRSGNSADVDLTKAASVTDVLDTINNTSGISVRAVANGDHIELQDLTGQLTTNLTVADKNGGHAASDLGIAQSVASSSVTGSNIYSVTGSFTLAKLNDGNQPQFVDNFPDLRISLTDPGATNIDVDLSGALTLNDVIGKINNATGNEGKVTASLSSGRIVLTDNTGGGGAQPLTATDLNGASVVKALGLDAGSSGNTLSGNKLAAGMNSVLLRNLRGGSGIDQLGQVTLTDRTGLTATIDLTNATSLDEVLSAINNAQDGSGNKLNLTASLNDAGNGLKVTDTSGGSASNLIITDVGAGTTATQLGIATNSAVNSVAGGSLSLRYVNEATSLSNYAPGGTNVRRGTISITDSTGVQHFAVIPDSAKTIGDVIQRINASTNGKVTAQLNETGDGLVLIDQAGGTGQMTVAEAGGKVATDLRLVGTGTTGVDGKSRVSGRQATLIDVTATDTLDTLVTKLNAAGSGFSASIIDDGSSFSPKRLAITSGQTGATGNFVFDDGGLGLGLAEHTHGQDALLRMGSDAATGFVISSSTNQFTGVVTGLDVNAKAVGTTASTVTVSRNTSNVAGLVQSFITSYNSFVKGYQGLTSFNSETSQRGVLQGDAGALQLSQTLSDLIVGGQFGDSTNEFRRLAEVGVSVLDNGQLSLDTTKLQSALDKNPNAVGELFTNKDTGFAAKFKKVVDQFTDTSTGRLTLEAKGLTESSDNIDTRITTLTDMLNAKRDRLTLQFSRLESLLSSLQSQQSSLTKIQAISAAS